MSKTFKTILFFVFVLSPFYLFVIAFRIVKRTPLPADPAPQITNF